MSVVILYDNLKFNLEATLWSWLPYAYTILRELQIVKLFYNRLQMGKRGNEPMLNRRRLTALALALVMALPGGFQAFAAEYVIDPMHGIKERGNVYSD